MGPKLILASFAFEHGSLLFTEASSKKRASLQLIRGETALRTLDPGGVEPLDASLEQFHEALTRESHTLKRALTDEEFLRLYDATRATLTRWLTLLRAQTGDAFPEKVTAFHEEMAVHGRYRLPCPVCGKPVQRIVYAANECNYCAACQTAGRLLADRSLSRLLRDDWPASIDDL